MKIFEIIIDISTLIVILAGLILFFIRRKFYLTFHDNLQRSQFTLILWSIWFPFTSGPNDSPYQIRKMKALNLALGVFYLMIVILFLSISIFVILK